MTPDDESKIYLKRWKSLEDDAGLSRVRMIITTLKIVGFVSAGVIVLGIYFHLHLLIVALAGTAFGYAMAEHSALQSRLRTWARMKEFLDWDRIEEALEST